MAPRSEEVVVRRVIACFAPGSVRATGSLARLMAELQAELVGLFIEDAELLRFAALPFAEEVGLAGLPRAVDTAAMERALRAQAAALRDALAAALGPQAPWSLRVARASPALALETALAEGYAPVLVIPPGADPRAERVKLRAGDITRERLQGLLGAGQPVLVLPD